MNSIEARDICFAVVKASMVGRNYEIKWPNQIPTNEPSANDEPFVVAQFEHLRGYRNSIGLKGSRLFERFGAVTVRIYGSRKNTTELYETAEAVLKYFMDHESPIRFRNPTIREVGEDGVFFRVDAVVEFFYDVIG